MLTDDDLTRELSAAFRDGTRDLSYAGRRRPRRTAAVAVPVAAVTLAVGALAINGVLSSPAGSGGVPSVHAPVAGASGATSADARTVTEKLELAGFSFTYQVRSGDDDKYPILVSRVSGGVPDDAREVALPGAEAQAWVGTDPATGDAALWVKAPTRNGGELFEMHSPRWTEADFVSLVRTGRPNS